MSSDSLKTVLASEIVGALESDGEKLQVILYVASLFVGELERGLGREDFEAMLAEIERRLGRSEDAVAIRSLLALYQRMR